MKTVAVGRKARDFLGRTGLPVIAEFTHLADYPSVDDARPLARVLMEEYIAGSVDRVYLVFPLFVNTMAQRPEMRQLLPIEIPPRESAMTVQYIYEPSPAEVFDDLLPRYVRAPGLRGDPGEERQRAVGANGRHAQRNGRRQRDG